MGDATKIASRLSAPMTDMLLRAVASNGGGLNGYSESRATARALYDRDLVQGKAGQPWCIVHTRLGLEVARHIKSERSK